MMLTATHQRNKIPLADSFGVAYPSYFIHPVVEYHALVEAAGVIDLTHRRVLRLLGKDRQSFLNAMITNDVASLETDRGCHSLITSIKGKIIAELFVFMRENDTLLVVAQGNADEAHDVLRKHIITEDVTIEDLSSQYGIIAIEGPKSRNILLRLLASGPVPKESFHAVTRQFEGDDIYMMANSVTGESGYHLMIPASHIQRVWEYLIQASRGSDGLPIGGIVWNMRRVEKGLPWYGVDFTEDNFPGETRLGMTISYTKGCFRGQETLARLHHRGHVNRILTGMTVADTTETIQKLTAEFDAKVNNYDEAELKKDAEPVAEALDLTSMFASNGELYPAGGHGAEKKKPAGRITSVVYSPQIKKPLLLGYLRSELAAAGGDVFLGEVCLKTVELPVS